MTTFCLKFQANKWEYSAGGHGEQRHVSGLVTMLGMERLSTGECIGKSQ